MPSWMYNAAPGLLMFAWIALAANYMLRGRAATRLDQVVNREQLLVLASTTLLVLGIHKLVPEAIAFQLFRLLLNVGGGTSCLVSTIWLGRPEPRRFLYVMIGVSSVVSCLFGIDGLRHNAAMDNFTDWTALPYWMASAGASLSIIVYVIRCYVLALRREEFQSERLMLTALIAFCAALIVVYAGLIWDAALNTVLHKDFSPLVRAALRNSVMLNTAFVTIGTTVNVVSESQNRLHLDRWSRRQRQLLPLWTDLTAACPEIVHLTAASATHHQGRYLLHRTTVEIRDCIFALSRFATPNSPSATAAIGAAARTGQDAAFLDWTVCLAKAVAAKARGDIPNGGLPIQRSTAQQLLDETNELIELARLWPQAKVIATTLPTYVAGDSGEVLVPR